MALRSGRVLMTTTESPTTVSLASPPMNGRKRRRAGDDDSPPEVPDQPPPHTTRSVSRKCPLVSTTTTPPLDPWRLDWLSPSRPRLFLNSFRVPTQLVIVQKMIDIFQSLISSPPQPAPHPPLIQTLRNRVRRATPSLHSGWEYDLEDFVFYLLSKRQVDRRIHDMLLADTSPTPTLFAGRLRQRYPDIVEPNIENIIDWHNNVIVPKGFVILSEKFAIMTVSQFMRILTNLQNQLVQSVRSKRRQR